MKLPKMLRNFLILFLLAFGSVSSQFETAIADISFPSSDKDSTGDYFKSLMKDDFEKILAKYAFIGDFRNRPIKRPISDEIFWKYSFEIPDVKFPLPEKFDDYEKIVQEEFVVMDTRVERWW